MNKTNQLFEDNVGLVIKIAKHMNYGYCDLDDLIQSGLMALYQATLKYDITKNDNFSAFATYYIIGALKKEMRVNQNIVISKDLTSIIKYIKNNDNKSLQQLSEEINCSMEKLLLALLYKDKCLSLNSNIEDDELIEFIPYEENKTNTYLHMAINSLNKVYHEIIILKYFKGYSQKEIALHMGFSQAKVSRLEQIALIQIKQKVNNY